ncbi:MAG: spore germination protein, partial [Clostridia bacterium]|nr:spore germination protein [Clostridia bacterium]
MFWRKLRRPTGSARRGPGRRETAAGRRRIPLSGNLDRNRALIVRTFGASADLVVREVVIRPEGRQALVVYLDGLADEKLIADDVVRPLLAAPAGDGQRRDIGAQAYQTLKRRLAVGSVEEVAELGDLARHLASGDCIVMVGGIARALACKTRAWPERTVEEPTAEAAVRGARDGFTEVLRTNTALLRHRVRDPRLRVEERQIGRLTETSVALVYIEGLAREEVVAEARARLARIDVDGVLESGYLEEYVEDAPYSPFPQMLRTERPDRVAAALLEGQIAILTDGTPFALLAPVTFIHFLTSVEDYYERYFMG